MLSLFAETLQKPKHPFIIIMGGAKILEKRDALHSLLHICDKLVFVGSMAFTCLSALGLSVSPRLVEKDWKENDNSALKYAYSDTVSNVFLRQSQTKSYEEHLRQNQYKLQGAFSNWGYF